MKLAVLFPGQGSQYVGMGKGFVESDQSLKTIMETAEAVCQFPLEKLCFDGPMEELTRAVHLQPAITITNIVCYEALKKALPDGMVPVYFAGHSLGEYSALYAAGVLNVENTMRLVAKRGALMEREGNNNPGGMRAVLGLLIDEVEKCVNAYSGEGVITAANHNCEKQIVVSGSIEALDAVCGELQELGGMVIPLNVSVANHSPLVADAVPDFADFMRDVEFHSPHTDVLFNVTSQAEMDVDIIKSMMAKQIASRVRWYESMNRMLEAGVDTFIEVGPKSVLTGMLKKIVPKGTTVKRLQVESPETLEKCLQKLL